MSQIDVVVRGGTVVSADGRARADVAIRDGRIIAVGEIEPDAAEVIDADGCYVIPGGVDGHVHLESPNDALGTVTCDDFRTGTIAAAAGGTTTVVDFAKRRPDLDLYDSYRERLGVAEGKPVIDYAIHSIVTVDDLDERADADIRRLVGEGVGSFKFYMAYPGTLMVDDRTLVRGMRLLAELGATALVHAENGALVEDATASLVSSGDTAEDRHLTAHPAEAELEAANRAIVIAAATGCRLLIVHVSSRLVVEAIADAWAQGVPVFGETCPQYLVTAAEDYLGSGFDAAGYICSPPIRERANQDALWHALGSGLLSTIGTDHAPYRLQSTDDLPRQKDLGRGDFTHVPNGVPGIEDRLRVVWEAGVNTGRLTPERFVDAVATQPAKILGLYPRKGAIVPGADADLVVWDPDRVETISAATHHMNVDYNLYEGMAIRGGPRVVLSRGDVVARDGRFVGQERRGRYLRQTAGGTVTP